LKRALTPSINGMPGTVWYNDCSNSTRASLCTSLTGNKFPVSYH